MKKRNNLLALFYHNIFLVLFIAIIALPVCLHSMQSKKELFGSPTRKRPEIKEDPIDQTDSLRTLADITYQEWLQLRTVSIDIKSIVCACGSINPPLDNQQLQSIIDHFILLKTCANPSLKINDRQDTMNDAYNKLCQVIAIYKKKGYE